MNCDIIIDYLNLHNYSVLKSQSIKNAAISAGIKEVDNSDIKGIFISYGNKSLFFELDNKFSLFAKFRREGKATIRCQDKGYQILISHANAESIEEMFNEILFMNNIDIGNDKTKVHKKQNQLMENRIKRISGGEIETSPVKRKSLEIESNNIKSKLQKTSNEEIDKYNLSDEQKEVIDEIKSGNNVFITGPAGSGKSYLLKYIIELYKNQNLCITSSTGISAYNINGITLHNWAGIPYIESKTIKECYNYVKSHQNILYRWKNTKILIIDEISMITSSMFDKLEILTRAFLKPDLPFGGIQLIITGDFLQLPPVNDDHFCFEAKGWNKCISKSFSLNNIYRQKDSIYKTILNEIRIGEISDESIEILNKRVILNKNADEIHLYTHKKDRNNDFLNKLDEKLIEYKAKDCHNNSSTEIMNKYCPAVETLKLKIGTKVLLIKTINPKDGLVNGMRGVVTGFSKTNAPVIKFGNGLERIISLEEWVYSINNNIYTRKQYPIVLGWAISIHKSQGLTLDSAVIDISKIFECGQAYVALSRVRDLNGLYLTKAINKDIIKAIQFNKTLLN